MDPVKRVTLDDMPESEAIAYLMATLGIPEDQAMIVYGFHTGEVKGDALNQDGEDPFQGFIVSRSGETIPTPKT